MTSPVPAGFAEAGPARVSGVATSAKHSAATPPLPQRRVDGVDKLVLLVGGSAEVASWAWAGCSRVGRAGKWWGRVSARDDGSWASPRNPKPPIVVKNVGTLTRIR